MDSLKTLELFAGIGGFSVGLERTGAFKTIGFCEIDEKCHKILRKNWPDVPIYTDVTKLSAKDLPEIPDVITGGFPCQDISIAGKGEGLDGKRSGLWWEFHRLIWECNPRWVIIENVSMLRLEDWDKCYDPSQRSGTMQNGIVYLLEPLVRLTRETGSGSWPTPTARDYKDTAKNWEDLAKYAHKKRLPCSVAAVEKRNGKLNPRWVDWLMGYPIDHTDCDS
tara:strand:+ start:77 stop:742 length:666 start_codon:yes stop_codon:yes gene_type:complete